MHLPKSPHLNPLSRISLPLGLFAASACIIHAATSWPADELPPSNGQLAISGGSINVEGGTAAEASFTARNNLDAGAYGGIDWLHARSGEDSGLVYVMDARGIIGQQDFTVRFRANHEEWLFVDIGVSSYADYSSGTGGAFPPDDQWLMLGTDALRLDVTRVHAEIRSMKPQGAEIVLRYEFLGRDGSKDSTIWGDTLNTVIGGTTGRGIVPSFQNIDDERHTVEFRLRKEVDDGRVGFGARYENTSNDRELNMHRSALDPESDRYVTQGSRSDSDAIAINAFFERKVSETMLVSGGALFTKLEGDFSGSRIYGSSYDPVYDIDFARRRQNDTGFLDLSGSSAIDQFVANLNVASMPGKWKLIAALRLEHLDQDSESKYILTDRVRNWSTLAVDNIEADSAANASTGIVDTSLRLSAEYRGIENWMPYARVDISYTDGDMDEDWLQTPRTPTAGATTNLLDRSTRFDRATVKAVLGTRWYPSTSLNITIEGYYKQRDNNYSHHLTRAANDWSRYPGFLTGHTFETVDGNARVTWKPFRSLQSLTRFDYQKSTIESEKLGATAIESAETESMIVSESLTWTPGTRFFLQGQVNYVTDQTITPASRIAGVFEGTIADVASDYWNASLNAFLVLTKRIDLQMRYYYFKADNFEDNSAITVPFGVSEDEHQAGVDLYFHPAENIIVSLHYTYYEFSDHASAGNADYQAHAVGMRLMHQF